MKNRTKRRIFHGFFAIIFTVIIIFTVLPAVNVQAYNPYGFNLYNQLDDLEKSIYDKLKNISPSDTEIDLLDEFKNLSIKNDDVLKETINTSVNNAVYALLIDYPEIFWIEGWEISYRKSSVQLTYMVLKPSVKNVYASNGTKMVNDMKNVINNFQVSGSTRYEKLKYIHDWLANRIEYDVNAPYAHEPYGALVDDKAVCEGYAEAFKLLCDKYSIPCVLVVGVAGTGNSKENHMWNYVQMEDGKWYAVDVTWDDQTEKPTRKIYYDFFLAGSDTVPDKFTSVKVKFSESHVESGNFLGQTPKTFSYPELSKTAYNPGNPGTTPSASPSQTPSGTPSSSKTPSQSITKTPTGTPAKTPSPPKTPVPSTATPKPSDTQTPMPSNPAIISPDVTESPAPTESIQSESTNNLNPSATPGKTDDFSHDNTNPPVSAPGPQTLPYTLIAISIVVVILSIIAIVAFTVKNT